MGKDRTICHVNSDKNDPIVNIVIDLLADNDGE